MLPRGGSRNHPALRKGYNPNNNTLTQIGGSTENAAGEFVELNSWRSQDEVVEQMAREQ